MEAAILPCLPSFPTSLETIVDRERTQKSIFYEACTASWQKLDEYHIKTSSAQAIATILDPRCKLQSFRNLGWRPEWVWGAEQAIQRIYQNQDAPSISLRSSTPSPATTSSSYLDDFMTAVFGSSQGSTIPEMSEVDIFLEEKVELPQVDPIEWWRTYESRFPNLSCMAQDYLAIPASSIPSERSFFYCRSVEIVNIGWYTNRDNPCSSPEYETQKPGTYTGFFLVCGHVHSQSSPHSLRLPSGEGRIDSKKKIFPVLCLIAQGSLRGEGV